MTRTGSRARIRPRPNSAVLDIRNVATRRSRAGLVRGRPHPNGGVANRAIASTRSRNLDFLGLRRTARWVGDVSRDSFRTDCCVPKGETPNGLVESGFVDRRHCGCWSLFRWLGQTDDQYGIARISAWGLPATKRLAQLGRRCVRPCACCL